VDLGLLPIKNIDLPEKLRRNTKAKKSRENKRNLGASIDERPEIVDLRTEFGHWEADTVVGKKDEGEPCVLTLVERVTRMCLWIKAENHTADAIQAALESVMEYFGEQKNEVFKTITGDNGSEFANLSLFEDGKLKVYFTHPYSSWEKGTNECHNKMLRRFILKGKSISDYDADDICFFADCINGIPRKILGYRTQRRCLNLTSMQSMQLDRCASRWLSPFGASPLFPFPNSNWCSIYSCYYFENYCNLLLQFAKNIKRFYMNLVQRKMRIIVGPIRIFMSNFER
jgi:IS30 family transposase